MKLIPIEFLGFAKEMPSLDTAPENLNPIESLVLCLHNGFGSLNNPPTVYVRRLPDFTEVAIATRFASREAVTSLITCDEILGILRSMRFSIGEIRPSDATYVLVSVLK